MPRDLATAMAKGADRGQLVDDHQHSTMSLELVEELDQVGLGVGQRPAGPSLPTWVQGHSVVGFAGHVDAAEHVEHGRDRPDGGARLGQLNPFSERADQPWTKRRQPRYEKASRTGPMSL